jgi:uncharacterized protein (DUF4415 family)
MAEFFQKEGSGWQDRDWIDLRLASDGTSE